MQRNSLFFITKEVEVKDIPVTLDLVNNENDKLPYYWKYGVKTLKGNFMLTTSISL